MYVPVSKEAIPVGNEDDQGHYHNQPISPEKGVTVKDQDGKVISKQDNGEGTVHLENTVQSNTHDSHNEHGTSVSAQPSRRMNLTFYRSQYNQRNVVPKQVTAQGQMLNVNQLLEDNQRKLELPTLVSESRNKFYESSIAKTSINKRMPQSAIGNARLNKSNVKVNIQTEVSNLISTALQPIQMVANSGFASRNSKQEMIIPSKTILTSQNRSIYTYGTKTGVSHEKVFFFDKSSRSTAAHDTSVSLSQKFNLSLLTKQAVPELDAIRTQIADVVSRNGQRSTSGRTMVPLMTNRSMNFSSGQTQPTPTMQRVRSSVGGARRRRQIDMVIQQQESDYQ